MSIVSMAEVIAQLGIDGTTPQQTVLQTFIDAADQYVTQRYGTLPSGTYTEKSLANNAGAFVLRHTPVLTVTSITSSDGATAYIDTFTIDPLGQTVTNPNISSAGTWTVVYTAGFATMPADLKLAVLFDLEGLYQSSEVGPPGALGAFNIDAGGAAPTRRPLAMWPRVDLWLQNYPTVA